MKNFAAMVTRMDRDIGKLFDLLRELKLDENTVVFFSGDNGPHKEGGVDAGEQNNVANRHPDVVTKIRRIFREARTESEHWPVKDDEKDHP